MGDNNQNKKIYDFRSDTVTIPTPEMRKVIAEAEVGDDVKNEDPTVHKLQDKVAQLCGKESALFVCSGVMSNQLAIRTHITNNYNKEVVLQAVIADSRAHVFKYELGGISFHTGCQVYPIKLPNASDFITASILESYIWTENDLHTPITGIICLENTLNGRVFPIEEIKKIREFADKHKIKMHLDGARLWNACIATGYSLKDYCQYFDSVSLCLSKGLGAPIGSILVGDKSFIERSKQYRKLFGGGWRQAGILAAACIYAIDNHWQKMKVDHENAKILRSGLVKLGFEADEPQTNMVYANSKKLNITFEHIIEEIEKRNTKEEKVLIEGGPYEARIVVHHQTPKEGIEKLLSILESILKDTKK